MTEASRFVVDVLRGAAPFICMLAVGILLNTLRTSRSRTRLLIAWRGLDQRSDNRLRQLLAGTLIPLVAITALTTAFSIEAEIRDGPNRMIAGLEAVVPRGDGGRYWVLQSGTDHFMNGSGVAPHLFEGSDGITAMKFTLDLAAIERPNGDRLTGLVLGPAASGASVSPEVAAGSDCAISEGRCVLAPGEAVVDGDDGYDLGERIRIRDVSYTVVAYFSHSMSLLNRSVLFAAPTVSPTKQPFGIVVDAPSREAVAAEVGDEPVQILSSGELEELNSRFWAGNGTPILMLLIVLIALFGGTAIFAGQRAEHAATRPVRRTLRSIGLTSVHAAEVSLARGLLQVLVPTPIGVALGTSATWVLNSSVLGFHARVGLVSASAAVGVVTVSSVVASFAGWLLERDKPLV